MAVISITTDFDVLEKYESLVSESLDGESVYIRAKETVEALVAEGSLDDAKKAEIISNVVGSIVSSITNSSMSTALAWATSEKEFALRKLEAEIQLDILGNENLLKAAQVDKIRNDIRLAKVESQRMYGVPVFDVNDNILSLSDTGKVYGDIQLISAQKDKTDEEILLTQQKSKESYAAVHKIVADTYVNYGNYIYSDLTATGLTTVTRQDAVESGVHVTLSEVQKKIAEEQAKGYTYNAWANALTGSASMLGTAIAAEYADFTDGSTGESLLSIVSATANNLKSASVPVF